MFPIDPRRALKDFRDLDLEVEGLNEIAAIADEIAVVVNDKPETNFAHAITTGDVTPANARQRFLEAATAQTAKSAARQIWAAANSALSKATAEAVRRAAPDILAALQPQFDEAAVKLAATVGVRVPAKAKQILNTPGMAQVHADRQEATRDLSDIARIRTSLATSYRWADREPSMSWFIAGAENLDRLEQAERLGRNWLGLIEAGYQLALNDPERSRQIVADAAAATARAKREREDKASEKARRIGRLELEAHQRMLEEAKR